MATPASTAEWNNYGILRVPGFPAPTGRYAAGIVDLMHQGLLVRLYYPTDPATARSYEYANSHFGSHRSTYTKAILAAHDVSFSGLLSGAMSLLTSPKLPAALNPPLLSPASEQNNESLTKRQPSSEEPSTNEEPAETNNETNEDLPTSIEPPISNEGENIDNLPSQQFPIIVFSHGLSSHFFCSNAICYDLASHGYIVASVEHKDSSSCIALKRVPGRGVQEGDYDRYIDEWIPFDKIQNIPMSRGNDIKENESTHSFRNTQVKTRANEIGEAYDLLSLLNEGDETIRNMLGGNFDFTQFKGRLNMNTAAVMGHSFGGGTVVQTLYQDERFRYGIALDAWLFPLTEEEVLVNGISQPLVFINVDTFQWPKNVARMMRLINHEKGTNISMYTLKGAVHMSQSDGPFVIIPGLIKTFAFSETDKYICHDVNMQLIHGFLKRYLHQNPEYSKSSNVPLLDGGEGCLDYVIYGTNIDWKEGLPDSEVDHNTALEPVDVVKHEEEPELKVQAEPDPVEVVKHEEEPELKVQAEPDPVQVVKHEEEPELKIEAESDPVQVVKHEEEPELKIEAESDPVEVVKHEEEPELKVV